VALYGALAQLAPSPIVELNRAVAVAMAFGPAASLELIDTLAPEPFLNSYHLLPSVRGDFLFKLGRFGKAQTEFKLAAVLTRSARERELLPGQRPGHHLQRGDLHELLRLPLSSKERRDI
jgi:predicted RNA polymerase sigma factor